MSCWICEKHKLKNLTCVSNTGILTQLNYKLCRTDNSLTSLQKKLYHRCVVLQQVSHNKYRDKLIKNTSYQEKSRTSYQYEKMMPLISSKLMCYYVGETHVITFLFMK